MPSTTANIEGSDSELIVGAKYGYAILNRKTGKHELIKEIWDERDDAEKGKRFVRNYPVKSHDRDDC